GATAEVVLDEGTIVCAEAEAPVCELELELRHGSMAPLYRLGLELAAQFPLLIEVGGKAARGHRLRSGQAPSDTKARDVVVSPDADTLDGFGTILAARLGELLANQPAADAGDVEGVHQMRIAIRRLRTALVLFAPHLESHTAERFAAELRR